MLGDAIFSGVFELREGVSEEEFLHFIDQGFASEYLILKRQVLDGFGKTLPAFTYRGELVYRDMEREQAAYEYVKQNDEPVRSLHHAMNTKVKRSADFFVETCIATSSSAFTAMKGVS
jgi:hypothetical protein